MRASFSIFIRAEYAEGLANAKFICARPLRLKIAPSQLTFAQQWRFRQLVKSTYARGDSRTGVSRLASAECSSPLPDSACCLRSLELCAESSRLLDCARGLRTMVMGSRFPG